MKDETIRVRAIGQYDPMSPGRPAGYYNSRRIYIGQEFDLTPKKLVYDTSGRRLKEPKVLTAEEQFSANWMERVKPGDPPSPVIVPLGREGQVTERVVDTSIDPLEIGKEINKGDSAMTLQPNLDKRDEAQVRAVEEAMKKEDEPKKKLGRPPKMKTA